MLHVCTVSEEAGRGSQIPWSWNYRQLGATWCVFPNPVLQEHRVLLTTEPSLQALLGLSNTWPHYVTPLVGLELAVILLSLFPRWYDYRPAQLPLGSTASVLLRWGVKEVCAHTSEHGFLRHPPPHSLKLNLSLNPEFTHLARPVDHQALGFFCLCLPVLDCRFFSRALRIQLSSSCFTATISPTSISPAPALYSKMQNAGS